jgi:DeoR family glycerol-3-phosphate regulon repressor
VRRDINLLCSRGLLKRYHGGAGLITSVENLAYATRKVTCLKEKRAIAGLVADHIPDNASLFLDIGTTSEEIAHALAGHQGLRVVTNNLNVAFILAANQSFEVLVTGGRVRQRDMGLTGQGVLDCLEQFKVDYGIITLSGIDADGAMLDYEYAEVMLARAMMRNSRRVLLAADHSKFNRSAMVRIGRLQDVDAVFTDRDPPQGVADMLADAGVELYHPAAAEACTNKTGRSRPEASAHDTSGRSAPSETTT